MSPILELLKILKKPLKGAPWGEGVVKVNAVEMKDENSNQRNRNYF